MRSRDSVSYILAFVLSAFLLPSRAAAQSSSFAFTFPDDGGVSTVTAGAPALNIGYARIQQTAAIAAAYATFSLRQNDVLVSEATVPAAELLNEGRIYTEIGNGVDTGIAIANPNEKPVLIGYYFTDQGGRVSGSDVLTLPPRGQISKFLSESPFNRGPVMAGTFTFFTLNPDPNVQVGAIALRGFVNERSEFLMTTLPITPVGQRGLISGDVLPHFAAGSGWATQVILVNPTDADLDGSLTFLDQAGRATIVNSELGSGSTFGYRIPAKSASRLQTSRAGELQVGSIVLRTSVPGVDIPVGFLIFSYQSEGITVSAAGVPPSRPATATRLFVETAGRIFLGQPNAPQTGFAVSNAASTLPVRLLFDLTNLDGTPTGLHDELDVPPGGQIARFVSELPGFATLPIPFQGVLRISSPSPVSVIGLRGRYNERGDFLVATIPAVNENDDYFDANLKYSSFVFPHFADGGGYTTQFVLYSGWTPGVVNGTLEFFTQDGKAFPIRVGNR